MESLVRSSFLDSSYLVDEHWQIITVQRLYNLQFASAYRYVPSENRTLFTSILNICNDAHVFEILQYGISS